MKTIINVVIGLLAGLLVAGALYVTSRVPTGQPITMLPTPTTQPIYVFVIGAVKHPGHVSFAGHVHFRVGAFDVGGDDARTFGN